MKREIKFRAWDKKNKKVHRVLAIDWNYQNIEYTTIPGQIISILSFSDVELMQFTGLKDKNGKEIYEGDIVSFGLDDKGLKEVLAEVRFVEGCFGVVVPWVENPVRAFVSFEHYPSDVFPNLFEVKGNVYENPELLKEGTE